MPADARGPRGDGRYSSPPLFLAWTPAGQTFLRPRGLKPSAQTAPPGSPRSGPRVESIPPTRCPWATPGLPCALHGPDPRGRKTLMYCAVFGCYCQGQKLGSVGTDPAEPFESECASLPGDGEPHPGAQEPVGSERVPPPGDGGTRPWATTPQALGPPSPWNRNLRKLSHET